MIESITKYNTTNIFALSIIGIAIKLLFGNNYTQDGTNGPASSALWGYGLANMAIFFLMFVQTNVFLKTRGSSGTTMLSNLKNLGGAILNILPTLLMFTVFSWLILLNYEFYKQINTGNVASEYKQFSTMSTVMVVFQLIVLFKYIMTINSIGDAKGVSTKIEEEASKYASVSYLLSTLNLVFVGMMNIIIIYFSTDV